MNPEFGFGELASAQAQPEVLVNAADRILARALAGEIVINFASNANRTLTATPVTPSTDDEWHYRSIVMTDTDTLLTTGRNVIYPDIDTLYGGPSRCMHVVTNGTLEDLTFKRSAQTGGVTVGAGERALIWHDGDEIVALINPLP